MREKSPVKCYCNNSYGYELMTCSMISKEKISRYFFQLINHKLYLVICIISTQRCRYLNFFTDDRRRVFDLGNKLIRNLMFRKSSEFFSSIISSWPFLRFRGKQNTGRHFDQKCISSSSSVNGFCSLYLQFKESSSRDISLQK